MEGEEIVIDLTPEPDNGDAEGPPAPQRIDLAGVRDGRVQVSPAAGKLAEPKAIERGGNGADLQKLPGVTAKMAQSLAKRGVTDLEDILDMGVGGLEEIDGIGPQKAKIIYRAAMEKAKDAVAEA